MRTHYGPWQPCWISNQHQKQKSGRGPSSEHFWQVWLISVQRFQRRRFKCEKLTDGRTDGRTTDAYPWQKLTWPMARWAKNSKYSFRYSIVEIPRVKTIVLPMVRTLLNIQLLFYGMTYLMILEKLPILTNLKTFYYLGMEMNANVVFNCYLFLYCVCRSKAH